MGTDYCIACHVEELLEHESRNDACDSDKKQLLEFLVSRVFDKKNDDSYSYSYRKNSVVRRYFDIAEILQIDLESMVRSGVFDSDLDSLYLQMELLETTYHVHSKVAARDIHSYKDSEFYKYFTFANDIFDNVCTEIIDVLFSPYKDAIVKKDDSGKDLYYRDWEKFYERFAKVKNFLLDKLKFLRGKIKEDSCDYDTSMLSVGEKHEQYMHNLFYAQSFSFSYEHDLAPIADSQDIPYPCGCGEFSFKDVAVFYHDLVGSKDSVEKIERRLKKFAATDPYLQSYLISYNDNHNCKRYKIGSPPIFVAHYLEYRKKNKEVLSGMVDLSEMTFPSTEFNLTYLPYIEEDAERNLSFFYAKVFPMPKYLEEVHSIFNMYLHEISLIFGGYKLGERDPKVFSRNFQKDILKEFIEISKEIRHFTKLI